MRKDIIILRLRNLKNVYIFEDAEGSFQLKKLVPVKEQGLESPLSTSERRIFSWLMQMILC